MPDLSGRKFVTSDLLRFIEDVPWGEEDSRPPLTRIEFSGERKVNAIIEIDRIGKTQKDAEHQLGSILSKADVKELLAAENRIFEWLEKDPSHPTRLALDPLDSLREAGVKLSRESVAALDFPAQWDPKLGIHVT